MPEDNEIEKPSLTQRRKISGSKSIAKSDTSPIKPMIDPIGGMSDGDDEDISIVKVAAVIVGVIVIAVIAAFLIIKFQSNGDKDGGDTTPTATVTETETPTETVEPTDEVDDTTTPTPTPTVTTTNSPDGENLDNPFSLNEQFITTGATGATIKIRTYQFENMSAEYTFALPTQAISGSETIPNANAKYVGDNLVLEVDNIGSFSSCTYLNDNGNFDYGNVVDITCAKSGSKYIFTIDVENKTQFSLTTGKRDVKGESLDAIILKIKNK